MTTIRTFSGRSFDYANPAPESICLSDIAHALAHVARFCGHTKQPYSVAQHCVLMAQMVEPGPLRAALLLHDATEAYMQDIPSPLKAMLPNYKRIEGEVWLVIANRYGIDLGLAGEVHRLDRVMLEREMRGLFGTPATESVAAIFPTWGAIYARSSFLREARHLSEHGWLKADDDLESDVRWLETLRARVHGTPVVDHALS